ncbi:MAG: hypothetical protein OXC68_10415, partial [Aestuariivita sp.]|nr:hypothetical protein [Aestuariivita sp.]
FFKVLNIITFLHKMLKMGQESTRPRQSDEEATPGNNTTEAHSPNDHGIFVGIDPLTEFR